MRGRGCVGGSLEIVAERRADRGLVALLDLHLLDDGRPESASVRIEQLGKRARFGFEALRLAIGFRQRAAQLRFLFTRGNVGLFGQQRALFGGCGLFDQVFERFRQRMRFFLAGTARREHREFGFESGDLGLETREPLRLVAHAGLCRGALGAGVGQKRLRIRQEPLGFRELFFRHLRAFGGFRAQIAFGFLEFLQFGIFRLQPRDRLARIVDQGLFALEIAGDLLDAASDFGGALLRALFLRFQRFARERDALQRRAGARFGVAQTGQAMRGDRLQARGFRLLRRAFGDFAHVGLELALGVGQILRGLAMQAERDQRLVLANVRRERLVARGLPRLTLQRIDLRVDLLHHVFETRQVFFRALQAQFRLVPARMQAGDAGGFFQNAAARLRLGGNDLADHALPHQRRRTRAGRGVGEQQLHVARAHLARIHAIGRAGLALDATSDLDQFAVVEGRGRGALGVVEHQPDFRRVARGAIAGAGEDHVVHAGRAHVLV